MLYLRVISKIIFIIFLVFSTTVNADDLPDTIQCPKLDKIQQAASLINQAECKENACVVMTDPKKPAFDYNGLSWGLFRYSAITSENEAINNAQHIASNISVMQSETTTRYAWYWCQYYMTSTDYSENEVITITAFVLAKNPQIAFIRSLLKVN
jgi:hypothetical protein